MVLCCNLVTGLECGFQSTLLRTPVGTQLGAETYPYPSKYIPFSYIER